MNEHLLVGRVRAIVRTWLTCFSNTQVQAIANSEAHNFPLHKSVAARRGVMNRLLEDLRDKEGLIFIRRGLYKWPSKQEFGMLKDTNEVFEMLGDSMEPESTNSAGSVAAFNADVQYAISTLAKKYGFTLAPVNIEWHPRSAMFYDSVVKVNSRDPNNRLSHLQKIAADWDWDKFNLGKIAPRAEGFALIDGAGTNRALSIVEETKPEYRDLLIPAHVILSNEDRSTAKGVKAAYVKEADKFIAQSNTKKLQAANFFIGELIAHNEESCAIRDVMAKIGMIVPNEKDGDQIAGWPEGFKLIPIMRVLHRERMLAKVMITARKVWPKEFESKLRHGMAAIAGIYKTFPKIDDTRLRKVLELHPYSEVQDNDGKEFGLMLHNYELVKPLANLYLDYYDHGDAKKGKSGKPGRPGKISGIANDKKLGGHVEGGKYVRDYSVARVRLNETVDGIISSWKSIKKPGKV